MLEVLFYWSSRRITSRHGRSGAKPKRTTAATTIWSLAARPTHSKRLRQRRCSKRLPGPQNDDTRLNNDDTTSDGDKRRSVRSRPSPYRGPLVGLLRPRLLDGRGRGDGTKRGKRARCPSVAGVPKSPRPAASDAFWPAGIDV